MPAYNNREPMTEKEKQVFTRIKDDPYVSQLDLAEAVGLSRPAVANIISGLVRKSYILGKAYVINETRPVVCIGAANVDRKYHVKETLQWGTSNPIISTESAGGVARNLAENLGRLEKETTLLTTAGMDADWITLQEASAGYMNMDHAAVLHEKTTGSYTAVLDEQGSMTLAFADMEIYESITPEYIRSNERVLQQAGGIAADLNCPAETLEVIRQKALEYQVPLMLTAVSAPKMQRLPERLEGVTWLVTNKDESEAALGVSIESGEDWRNAASEWLEKGAAHVVITGGGLGAVIGSTASGIFHLPSEPVEKIADVTGAGDAFCAALFYAWLEGWDVKSAAEAGMIQAAAVLTSDTAGKETMTADWLNKRMEERS
ncbi:PfkB family carbohydrate kinase [Salibacterium halotolerans]|uniref:Sugar or nucleoside kinase, ribokinase family n=1 Tax=Salibacterium halotolerans TaxID=1884432 RepID=A0A1I5U2P8_9BACI|nr:PfkB family carbohydrate kinase [Salibacterium halotolerans]SFP88856.1 Sugar or nucleoside kinase, ribokinase family [Salibacterium halotolerans]